MPDSVIFSAICLFELSAKLARLELFVMLIDLFYLGLLGAGLAFEKTMGID